MNATVLPASHKIPADIMRIVEARRLTVLEAELAGAVRTLSGHSLKMWAPILAKRSAELAEVRAALAALRAASVRTTVRGEGGPAFTCSV